MHILMTGGTGLIGTATCAALHTQGHELTILSRRARSETHEATYITALRDCAEPVDAVINLAGAGLADRRWSDAYKRQIVSSRVGLTRDLVTWLSELDQVPERLISASAIGYYGIAAEQTFTEDADAGEGFAAALCQSWEEEAQREQLQQMEERVRGLQEEREQLKRAMAAEEGRQILTTASGVLSGGWARGRRTRRH